MASYKPQSTFDDSSLMWTVDLGGTIRQSQTEIGMGSPLLTTANHQQQQQQSECDVNITACTRFWQCAAIVSSITCIALNIIGVFLISWTGKLPYPGEFTKAQIEQIIDSAWCTSFLAASVAALGVHGAYHLKEDFLSVAQWMYLVFIAANLISFHWRAVMLYALFAASHHMLLRRIQARDSEEGTTELMSFSFTQDNGAEPSDSDSEFVLLDR